MKYFHSILLTFFFIYAAFADVINFEQCSDEGKSRFC